MDRTHTSLHSCSTNAEHTHTDDRKPPNNHLFVFSSCPQWPSFSSSYKQPWADIQFLAIHMMSNTWLHKHLTTSLPLTEHRLALLCISHITKTRRSVILSLFSLIVLQANVPREGFTDGRVDKDKGLLVCAETGESSSKEDRSYTKKQILFSQRQKNESAALNTNKAQYVCVCALNVHVSYVCERSPQCFSQQSVGWGSSPWVTLQHPIPAVCDCVWTSAASAALYTEGKGQSIHTLLPHPCLLSITSPHPSAALRIAVDHLGGRHECTAHFKGNNGRRQQPMIAVSRQSNNMDLESVKLE